MHQRTSMTEEERYARSKLVKIIHDNAYIEGALVKSKITCGKKNCRCAKGSKHSVVYLAYREGRKRKLLFIPQSLRKEMGLAIVSYKEARKLGQMISIGNLKRIFRTKQI